MAPGSFAASDFSLLVLFLPMPHTSRMSYLSFFRKSVLGRFWLLQEAGKLWETAQAEVVTSDVFPSPPLHAARHRRSSPYMLQLNLIPRASPTACRDECVAPAGLPCWLQNLRGGFFQWGLDPRILPHTVGSLALRSVGREAQKLPRLSQGAGGTVDSCPTAPTTPSSA